MNGILKNSSLSNREEMMDNLTKMSQPNPQQQQLEMNKAMQEMKLMEAQIAELQSKVQVNQADAQKTNVEANLAPEETKAKVLSSISRNLPSEDNAANIEFDRRVKVADLMLREEEVQTKKEIVRMQMEDKKRNIGVI